MLWNIFPTSRIVAFENREKILREILLITRIERADEGRSSVSVELEVNVGDDLDAQQVIAAI